MLGSWVPWSVCLHSINSGPRVHAWGGAGGQNLGHPKKVLYYFFFYACPSWDVRSDISHPYDPAFRIMRWRSEWPIFYGIMILPNILKTIWWMNVILGIMGQCDKKDWPHKIYVDLWPIFHCPVILPFCMYLENYFIDGWRSYMYLG